MEKKDLHERTAFRLAVELNRFECVQVLLEYGCDAGGVDSEGWTAVHDATSTGNARLLRLVLEQRNKVQRSEAQERIPQLLHMLESDQDFYVEMSWDFSSWVPLVSRLCPSDVYRIWKRGSCVRVDTTLLGYSNLRWLRGHRTYIFRARPREGDSGIVEVEVVQINHDRKEALLQNALTMDGSKVQAVTQDELEDRLNAPISATTMDTEAIGFSRTRTGIWGFQSDKAEAVGDVVAKVFSVSGIELVTKTRFEHLPRDHPSRRKGHSAISQMMTGIMGSNEDSEEVIGAMAAEGSAQDDCDDHGTAATSNASMGSCSETSKVARGKTPRSFCATAEEYFRPSSQSIVVGRPREQREHRQVFKAKLWMSDEFPLSLQRQILPIVDLMAPTSQHIAKLRDFISLQLPTGFPVKIEIPVYHFVNARVTFSNFCREFDASIFDIPADYALLQPTEGGGIYYGGDLDEDDDALLARAMQLSLADQPELDDEELLRRVLAESLAESQGQRVEMGALLPSSSPLSSLPAPWNCQACTFSNSGQTGMCEMCGTPRPGAAMPSRILAEEERMLQQAIAMSMTSDDDLELHRVLELSKSYK